MACAAVILLCGAGAPAQAQNRPPEVKLSANFVGLRVNVDGSGDLVVVAALHDIGGRLAACGLIFPDGAKATAINRRNKVLEAVVITFQGRALPVYATAFAWFDTVAAAEAGKARCSVSGRPWQAVYGREKPGIRLRSNSYRD